MVDSCGRKGLDETPQGDSNRLGRLSTRRPGTAITRPTEDHLSQRLHDQRPGTAITRPIGNRLLALGSSAAHGKRPPRVEINIQI